MIKVITAAVFGLGVAFAAGALAQQSRVTAAVTLHIVSPTGEATTLAIDRGEITLAVVSGDWWKCVTPSPA
jgi:signal recognition particle receptor subunit beta